MRAAVPAAAPPGTAFLQRAFDGSVEGLASGVIRSFVGPPRTPVSTFRACRRWRVPGAPLEVSHESDGVQVDAYAYDAAGKRLATPEFIVSRYEARAYSARVVGWAPAAIAAVPESPQVAAHIVAWPRFADLGQRGWLEGPAARTFVVVPLQPCERDYDAGGALAAAAGPSVTCTERRTQVVLAGCNSPTALSIMGDFFPGLYGYEGATTHVSGLCCLTEGLDFPDNSGVTAVLAAWLRNLGAMFAPPVARQ